MYDLRVCWLAWSSVSSEFRRKLTFASSAVSEEVVWRVLARSGAGEERYDRGVSGRFWVGVCGLLGLLCA